MQSALLSAKHELDVCQRQHKAATISLSDRDYEIETLRQKAATERSEYQSNQQATIETNMALERQIHTLRTQLAVRVWIIDVFMSSCHLGLRHSPRRNGESENQEFA